MPRFIFVRDLGEVNEQTLRGFGHSLIVKIVSPGIPHKQKLGGVKKVSAADPLYVQFVLSRMREEVLSHFAQEAGPPNRGLSPRGVHPPHAGHRLRGADRFP